jgi:hypothetical protein
MGGPLRSRISSTQRTAVVVAGEPHQHSTGNRRLYAGPGIETGKMVCGSARYVCKPLRRSLAVFGMQTGFHFAKIICEFFVLIPKLAFVSR